jgi:hypothetical protein
VFTLIGHLFSQLPFGDVAWRVHLVSALFGGLTCAVIWCIVRSLVSSRPIATAAALAYGFSEVFWSQAIIAEVYTLNTFITFLLVLMLLSLSAQQSPAVDDHKGGVSRSAALGLGFVYGLGLSNHWPLLVLFSPAYLLLGWPVVMPLLRRTPLLLLGLGLGLLPYVWLYLRSQADPEISFFGSLDGWSQFTQFVSRSTYSGADHEPGSGWGDKLAYLTFFGKATAIQLTPYGLLLALAGVADARRHARVIFALLSGAFCVSVLLILLLDRGYDLLGTFVFRVYPLPAYGVLAILAGLGLHRVMGLLERLPTAKVRVTLRRVAPLLLVVLPFLVHASQNSRGDFRWAEAYARAALDELPTGATLFVAGDIDALPIGYLRLVEGYRPDVKLVSTQALLFRDRPFQPRQVTANPDRLEVLGRYVEQSENPVCFVGVTSQFGDRFGLRWNGLTSCYDTSNTRVYSAANATAIRRYMDLQKLRDADSWSMMAADSLDGHMVRVLIIELKDPDGGISQSQLHLAIDQARNGFRGKIAFVDYSLALGLPLSPDETLSLLAEARAQPERAYGKKDILELNLLTVSELERAGRDDEVEPLLWQAVKLKPTWDNVLLPRLLTRLFQGRERAKLSELAGLDPDLAILEEVYAQYEASNSAGFAFSMRREGLEVTFSVDGAVEIEKR